MTKRTSFKSITIGGAAAWAMTLAAAAHAQEGEKRDSDIEAQPLAKALLEFNEQSGVLVMAPQALVEGKTAPAIEGEITADEALDRILSGSGLKSNASDSGAFTITRASAEPTDPRPFEIARLEDTPTRQIEGVDEDEGDELVIDVIIVTGTNIRGVENPTTPVLRFDRDDIDLTGAATVEDFLSTIPQNFGSETPLTQNTRNPFSSGSNSTQGTAVDIRGLGAGSTLTLLNGRRMTASGSGSFVDVSVLPLEAIDRVDVQTDGASAIYGSDAVGGVVNFVTRSDFEGVEVGGQYGGVTDGSKEDFSVRASGGTNWGSGGGFISVSYLETKPLLSSERDFIDTDIANPDGSLGAESEKTSVFASLQQELFEGLNIAVDGLYSDREFEFDQQNFSQITFRGEQESLFLNTRLEYKIFDHLFAELFVDYSKEDFVNTDNRFGEGDFSSKSVFENELTVYEGRIGGQLFDLPTGSIDFAIGFARREEGFKQIDNKDADRTVDALFGELLIPLINENSNIPFAKSIDLSLAGRYEDYSDFGSTFNPKVGLAWQTTDTLLLRTSYSEAFRAPVLDNINGVRGYTLFLLPSSLYTSVAPPAQDPRLPAGLVTGLVPGGANPDLTEETAEVWTAGFSYEPKFVEGAVFEFNYFDIHYTDRIEQTGLIDPIRIPEFSSLVQVPPNPDDLNQIISEIQNSPVPNFGDLTGLFDPNNPDLTLVQSLINSGLQNISERAVRGIDAQASYRWDFGAGQINFDINASYLLEYSAQVTGGESSADELNLLYRPIDLRLRGIVGYSTGSFTSALAVSYQNGYEDSIDPAISNSIDAWTTVDLSLAYQFADNAGALAGTRIGLNFGNLFDEEPPFVETPLDGLNYDSANADPFGRTFSASVSKRF